MANIVLAVLAVVVSALYGFGISQIPVPLIGDALGPRTYPTLLVISLLGVSVLLFVEGLRTLDWDRSRQAVRTFLREDFVIFATASGAILAFFLLFERLGYVLSTFALLLGFMLVLYRGPRWIAVTTAASFCGVSYLLFVHVFGTQLPNGILPV